MSIESQTVSPTVNSPCSNLVRWRPLKDVLSRFLDVFVVPTHSEKIKSDIAEKTQSKYVANKAQLSDYG